MKNKRVHISVSGVLSIFLIVCAISFVINTYLHKNYNKAFAKEEVYVENGMSERKESKDKKYTYRINKDGKTIEIISYLCKNIDEVDIPKKIDGYIVTGLGEAAFAYHDELRKVTVPNGVKKMELAVFGSCPNLKTVIFLADVQKINEWAFVDYKGTIVTTKDSNVWKCAKKQMVKLKEKD